MKTIEFLSSLRSLGVKLWVDGDKLRYSAPSGTLAPALRAELAKRKAEILMFLRKTSVNTPPIPSASRDRDLPLSFAQQRLWFLDQLEPGNPAYNIPAAMRLRGALNVAALEQGLNEVVQRHEVLRTTFSLVEGQPVQVIAPTLTLTLPVVDLRNLPGTQREAEALWLATEEARRPFDLARGPLLRATLLRLDEEDHVLLLTMHHIVSDGWSMGIVFRELSALYEAFSKGKPSPLPELPIQYADFAVWQQQWLQGEVLEAQLSYWKKQLAGYSPSLDLPTDCPRPVIQTHRGVRQSLVLSKTLSASLKALSRQEGTTLFMTLLAAFQALLYRYTGQDDIIVGSPIANRNRSEIEGLIGFFLNTLVLRTDLSGTPSFRELLARVREVTLRAYGHQDLPFEKLLEELQPERDLSRTPLFQVFLNMLNFEGHELKLRGLTVERLRPSEPDSNFDLTLYASEEDEEIHLELVYNTDLFRQDRMVAMLEQFKHLLSQIVENPEGKITRFSLVTPTAEKLLPNPTQVLRSDWQGAVHTQFSQQAQRFPERLAAVDKQETWTYKELDARSNQLANYLIASGVQPQDIVAIYGHRSASLVWAVLGVLKAGAAFLILDPAYPAPRLIDYVHVAKPRGWIQIEAAGELPADLEKFVTTLSCGCHLRLPQRSTAVACGFLEEYSTDDPEVEIGPDNLAYVAFTSGSTGRPKGTLGRHGPLSYFQPWLAEAFSLSVLDRFSTLSGLSHDPLQRDIFTPLWLGATICIPDADIIETPGRLADWMAQEKITFTHLTPAMGQILTETVAPDCRIPSLRYAFFVGDKLTQRDVARLRRLALRVTCINSYGSTETQRAVGYYVIPPEPEPEEGQAKAVYPLGRGMPDVQLLVLNVEQQLAGVGEIGEIYVRSPHLAQGYLGNEALTKARFLTNPFTGAAGDRLYKTGDLGRYLPDGNVEFLGRADHQVKIRGFRVEPREIEAVLGQHPAVREAVALAREDEVGEKRLVAYVVPNQEQVPTTSELRSFLKAKLPEYMVPSTFVMLEALPLTPNGKVDRRALPMPDTARPKLEKAFVAPRDTLELQLTKIWEQFLGLQLIGVQDNFFELGGHSLLAVRVFAQIEKVFGQSLPLATLFQAPTVEQLANVLRQKGWSTPWSSLVAIQPGGSKPPFFCVPGNLGNVFVDLGDLARHFGPDQPFYGLQDGIQNPSQIEALAAHYVDEIRAVQPEGPYLLGGVCSGGVVAFEMAQQLQAQGQKVALLALVEPLHPPVPGLRSYIKFAAFIIRRLVRRFGHHSRNVSQLGSVEQGAYIHLKAKLVANSWALRRYAPQPYPGRIALFLANESLTKSPQDPQLGWRELATSGVEVHVIPGTHDTITRSYDAAPEESQIQALAEQLRACIDEAQFSQNQGDCVRRVHASRPGE